VIGESNTLEGLLAAGAACIAEEWVRAMFEVTKFDPDEVHGFMESKKAPSWATLTQASRRYPSGCPAMTPARFGHLNRGGRRFRCCAFRIGKRPSRRPDSALRRLQGLHE